MLIGICVLALGVIGAMADDKGALIWAIGAAIAAVGYM